jgi:hypothetical protein
VISTVGLLAAIVVLIVTPLAVLYLPLWASFAAAGVLLAGALGGKALLFKVLIAVIVIMAGGLLWQRRRDRKAAAERLAAIPQSRAAGASPKPAPRPLPEERRAA